LRPSGNPISEKEKRTDTPVARNSTYLFGEKQKNEGSFGRESAAAGKDKTRRPTTKKKTGSSTGRRRLNPQNGDHGWRIIQRRFSERLSKPRGWEKKKSGVSHPE